MSRKVFPSDHMGKIKIKNFPPWTTSLVWTMPRVFKRNPTNYGELEATSAAITAVETKAKAIYTTLKLWFPALFPLPLPGLFYLPIDVFWQCCLSLFVNQINSRLVPHAVTQSQVGFVRLQAEYGGGVGSESGRLGKLLWSMLWDPGCDDVSRWRNALLALSLPFWLKTKTKQKNEKKNSYY